MMMIVVVVVMTEITAVLRKRRVNVCVCVCVCERGVKVCAMGVVVVMRPFLERAERAYSTRN